MKDIILKITEKCNSACAYCDVVANKKNARHMPIDVLEVVFKRIDDFLASHPQEGVNVIWHGGEPLLLSPDFYAQAHQIQCDFCASTMDRITHGMQTNLTLLTEEHLAVFSKFEMSLGTSYDPAPGIRGAGFPNDSHGYNERFHRAAALALRHGLVPGIIYVVTRKSLENPLDIFHFLSNMTNNGAFSMNPVLIYDDRRPDLSITPMEYVDFLGRIFPVWWETSQRYAEVDPFSSLTRIIRDGKMSLGCCHSGRCAYSHLNIAPDGALSHCGRSGDWGLLTYGSILELSLTEAFNSPLRKELADRNEVLRRGECASCRFWTICHGGCPLDAWPQHGSFMHKSQWCLSIKGFIEKYFEPVTGLRFKPYEKQ